MSSGFLRDVWPAFVLWDTCHGIVSATTIESLLPPSPFQVKNWSGWVQLYPALAFINEEDSSGASRCRHVFAGGKETAASLLAPFRCSRHCNFFVYSTPFKMIYRNAHCDAQCAQQRAGRSWGASWKREEAFTVQWRHDMSIQAGPRPRGIRSCSRIQKEPVITRSILHTFAPLRLPMAQCLFFRGQRSRLRVARVSWFLLPALTVNSMVYRLSDYSVYIPPIEGGQ